MAQSTGGSAFTTGWNFRNINNAGKTFTNITSYFPGTNILLPWGMQLGAEVIPPAPVYAATPPPPVAPVSPTIDPKIEANALYGKAMALYTGGYARMGSSPAPLVGPFISGGKVDMIVSFGVPSNPAGDRKIYKIYLDNELAWTSTGGGTLPAHGTFTAEAFDFIFKPGTLTQTACSLETTHYPGDENAYRPQMLLQIIGLPYARFMANSGKPVPYCACEIGDVTDGADPLDFINLGEALERIAFCPWANYTSTTFQSVGVTDMVQAILIRDNFTVIQICQNVTGEYRNIDLVLSDKVRVKDRGSNVTPDFVFDRDSIIGGDGAISVARGSATAQRREHELIAIDPDQDYTAVPSLAKIPRDPMVISAAVGKETVTSPLVIDASTRQALATFAQNYKENARRRVSFKVRASGYEIEPGDLFALTDIVDGFDNEVFKCVQTSHGANWVVEVEGEAILRCAIYAPAFDPYLSNVVLLLGFEGNMIDESPSLHGAAGILNAAQVSSSQAKYGSSSLQLDGSFDSITFNDSVDWTWPGSFTIEAFIRPASVSGTRFIIAQWQGAGTLAWVLYTDNDTLKWNVSVDGSTSLNDLASAATFVTNTWYHVCVDFDGTTYRLYIDGVKKAGSTTLRAIHDETGFLSIGANRLGSAFHFQGYIDEVRITKGVARYATDGTFTPPTAAFPRV